MFIKRAPEYDNVVQIREASAVKHPAEYDCHQAHEYGRSRREFERHDRVLKKSKRRAESCFLSVIRMQFDLIVSYRQVKRREKL